jgi:hypothetical protein
MEFVSTERAEEDVPFEASAPDFHVVSVGWVPKLIEGILDRVQSSTGIRFSHIMVAPRELASLRGRGKLGAAHPVRSTASEKMPPVDLAFLASLEAEGVPTVHNMLLCDRVLRLLPYEEGLSYATLVGRRLESLYGQLRPSVVLGGFDSLHGSMGLAVARKLGIPWYCMYFTTLPQGRTAFCSGITPDSVLPLGVRPQEELRQMAQRTIDEFVGRRVKVSAYESPRNLSMVVRKLPAHARVAGGLVFRLLAGKHDRYTEYGFRRLAIQYLRKRRNLLSLPRANLIEEPPQSPFIFFGLHMQPESSIDTWAPFYTDQLKVVEVLARAMPPTHTLLVKIHKSDADAYSPSQMRAFTGLPGVHLVSPFVESRLFLERASLVVAIQGTMAVEAALLSKPVLMFGESSMQRIPGVSAVVDPRMIPIQMRRLLSQAPPGRTELEEGFARYLGLFGAGCYYDFEREFEDAEIRNLADRFVELREHTLRAQTT